MEKIDSKLQRRQLELMKKRFDVDEEKKTVKLALHYEKASEVLDTSLDSKIPTFDRSKFDFIKDTISDFRPDYKTDLSIQIDDYEDYKADEIMEGFNDAVELTHYSGNREHKKKFVQVTFLIIAGVLLLNIIANGYIIDLFGFSEIGTSVFKEVLDISSWVFIWEAVSLMFLRPSEDRLISLTLAHRLKQVSFLDKKGEVTAKEDYSDSYADTAKERKLRITGKYALLLSGAAFFALGSITLFKSLYSIPSYVSLFQESGGDLSLIVLISTLMSIDFLVFTFEILGGIAALSAFTGRIGKLYKLALPFGLLSFVLEATGLILSIVMEISFVDSILGMVIATAYLFGVIALLITREKRVEKRN